MTRLLERDDELRVVMHLVSEVRRGGAAAVLLEGVAGIGKTSLLAEAVRASHEAGLAVRTARGGELERDLPYGVVVQLFEADATRPEVLHDAARLAAGVLRLEDPAHTPSEHATMHGLYWLVANLAELQPLVVVVDDVHWADEESVRWLSYLLRRLEGLAVGVVLAARPQLPLPHGAALGVLRDEPLLTVLRPRPLSAGATAATVAAELGTVTDADVAAACHTATGGNPLLVNELVRTLRGLTGAQPTAADVARLAPEGVAASVRRRLAALPPSATTLAEALAVLGTTSLHLAAAVAGLDPDEAAARAGDLTRAGIVLEDGGLELEHPVVRTTVYEQLQPAKRAQLHARAVDALLARGADAGQVAHHVVASPAPSRARHVSDLLAAAREAAGRGAPEAAVRWLTAALPDLPQEDVADALVDLGRLEAQLGRPDALDHLRTALRRAAHVPGRGAAALELAELLALSDSVRDVIDVVSPELLDDVERTDTELGLRLRAAVAPAAFLSPLQEVHDAAAAVLGGLPEPSGRTPGEREVLAALALLSPAAGEVARLAQLALGGGRLPADELPRPSLLQFLLLKLTLADELELVEDVLETALERARADASTLGIVRFTFLRSAVAARRGDFARSVTEAWYALEALEDETTRQLWPVGVDSTLYRLAASMTSRGDLHEARETIARWRTRSSGQDLAALQVHVQLIRIDLAEGHRARALEQLRPLVPLALTIPQVDLHYGGVLALAAPLLSAAGERELALQAAATTHDAATAWGTARAVGVALVARGLARQGDEGVADLEEACRVLEGAPAPFERATALVELGAALRRAGRRADARGPLAEAVSLAHECGARPLIARATEELSATGSRPRRLAVRGVDALTPSELRVALLAAEGRGNVEIAQALFISRKTVEKHLGNAFTKLDIASRGELAHALASEQPPGT